MKEYYYDKLLKINTRQKKVEVNHSVYYHPYEPTPYSALEELFKHYPIKSSDTLVDFGCGKGRLNFFTNYLFHASCIGIEMNQKFLDDAFDNLKNYQYHAGQIQFVNCYAEKYKIEAEHNKFYFFNPFTVQVFMKVVNNILRSVEAAPREIDIILYYASDDYRYFLETSTNFELVQEVPLPVLYDKNPFERFLIYRLNQF
ncbi:methyltransferase [Lysinibacillus endophyticus]|uniref:Methyltransferase n=1 Tax=Ureibacillus endophyticus TaxID=1978490 RepID=A0A494Z766_9BACL|nr:methyltransferase [Lysinibacillus endophyticus]MCP1145024.1 SAM-dependent methyltransferase [Lysinibacillus endophyticus]RKQ18451.1 methyltransferase [Lysinibacillus endophyticus]